MVLVTVYINTELGERYTFSTTILDPYGKADKKKKKKKIKWQQDCEKIKHSAYQTTMVVSACARASVCGPHGKHITTIKSWELAET